MPQLLLTTAFATEKVLLERNVTACGERSEMQEVGQEPPQRQGMPKCCLSPGSGLEVCCPEPFPESSHFCSTFHVPCQGIEVVGHSTCPQIFKSTVRKTILIIPLHSSSCLCPLFTSLDFLMGSGVPPSATAYSPSNICTFFHTVMDLPWTPPSLLSPVPFHSFLAL